jgi:hypothetical protein
MTDDKKVVPLSSKHKQPSPDDDSDIAKELRAAIAKMIRNNRLSACDVEAIEHGDKFKARFGIERERGDRLRLIDLCSDAGLTDSEVIWLQRSGSLGRGDNWPEISASKVVAMWGWALIGFLWLMLGIPLLHGVHRADYAMGPTLLAVVIAGFMAAGSRGIYCLHILPWQVEKRVLRRWAGARGTLEHVRGQERALEDLPRNARR